MYYAGDTYNFILNIPNPGVGTETVTSAPLITVLDILNPGTPIVSGASMTLVTGTSFIYYYAFAIPSLTPRDYVAFYSYATSTTQPLNTATAATWLSNVASLTFPLPLPVTAIPGNKITTTGFSSAGPGSYNVTNATILTTNLSTGVITINIGSNPGVLSVLGSGTSILNVTTSNQLSSLTDKLHVGDSNITGQVALNATVAQNSTVAKDATVMKSSQYVAPQNDPLVQSISVQTTTINTNTSSMNTVIGTLSMGTISGLVQDIYDASYGSITIDQTANPPIMYIKRVNGTLIASFQLINNNVNTQRNVLTSPPESSI